MKFQNILITGCKDMGKKLQKYPQIEGYLPFETTQDFLQKSGAATFVPLWCSNFMQNKKAPWWSIDKLTLNKNSLLQDLPIQRCDQSPRPFDSYSREVLCYYKTLVSEIISRIKLELLELVWLRKKEIPKKKIKEAQAF